MSAQNTKSRTNSLTLTRDQINDLFTNFPTVKGLPVAKGFLDTLAALGWGQTDADSEGVEGVTDAVAGKSQPRPAIAVE